MRIPAIYEIRMFITMFTRKLHSSACGLYYILSQMKPIHAPYHIYFRRTSVLSSRQRPFLTKQSFPLIFSKQKFACDLFSLLTA